MGGDTSERSSAGSISRFQGQKILESLNQGKASKTERLKTLVSEKIQRCLISASDKSIKEILNPLGPFSGVWDTLFLLSSVIAMSLDPLFFYLPVVNEDKKCLFMDRKLGIAAMVLRSVLDGLYIIYVFCRVLSPAEDKGGNSSRDGGNTAPAREYFLSGCFLVDIIAVLPLPQVVVFVIIPTMRDVRFLDAMNLLTIVVICQFIPRVLRIYPLFKRDKRTSSTLAETTWAKAAFNLFLYMLAGHALGALWYCLAIEREALCWQKACANHMGCVKRSFYCNESPGEHTFINDFCPISTPNSKLFDFGIFLDALQAGVLEVNFPEKFVYCFRWGLQNLSCFGQNLRTSTCIWENCFALFVTVFGLLLFISLIGNVQIYLQSKTIKSEELRLRTREIEQWKPFKKLSNNLRKEIKQYQRYKWQESRGVEVENLLKNFPREMIMNIKRELCLELLKKVKHFSRWEKRMLHELCFYAKPVLFIKRSYVRKEGDPINEMLFIVQGKLRTYSSSGSDRTGCLKDGDFCGEELLEEWLYHHPSSLHLPLLLPTSTRNIQALTNVEAFSLLADDLLRVSIGQPGKCNLPFAAVTKGDIFIVCI